MKFQTPLPCKTRRSLKKPPRRAQQVQRRSPTSIKKIYNPSRTAHPESMVLNATEDVLSAIPHRPPFLFVDRVLEITDTSIVAERTLRAEENFFKGHYPQMPIMPGVLMCEALFQTAGILMSRYLNETDKDGGKIPVLTRIESAKFRQPAFPGDCLRLEVQLTEKMKEFYFFKGNVKKGEKLLIALTFMLGMVPKTAVEP